MNEFQQYKQAYDAMNNDNEIVEIRKEIEALHANYLATLNKLEHSLAELEQPYKDVMTEAEAVIRKAVLESQKTVELHGVVARYTKGRKSTSWKNIAIAAGATDEDIALHTKESAPSVAVFVADVS